jgi:hypothetical protein
VRVLRALARAAALAGLLPLCVVAGAAVGLAAWLATLASGWKVWEE